jgi:hypothetical protein
MACTHCYTQKGKIVTAQGNNGDTIVVFAENQIKTSYSLEIHRFFTTYQQPYQQIWHRNGPDLVQEELLAELVPTISHACSIACPQSYPQKKRRCQSGKRRPAILMPVFKSDKIGQSYPDVALRLTPRLIHRNVEKQTGATKAPVAVT